MKRERGGLVTTVEDLAKFLAAQMKPGVFSGEMLDHDPAWRPTEALYTLKSRLQTAK